MPGKLDVGRVQVVHNVQSYAYEYNMYDGTYLCGPHVGPASDDDMMGAKQPRRHDRQSSA